MAKKSGDARSPVRKKEKSSAHKLPKRHTSPKRKQSLSPHGMGASGRGAEPFKTLAENAPDVMFRVDRHLRFAFVNHRVTEFTGIPKERFYGRTLLGLGLPKDFCLYLGKQVQEVFARGTPKEFEFTFDGHQELRWLHAHIVPECDIQGNVKTALGIAHDITDLKRAEEAFRVEYVLRKSIEDSLLVGIAAIDQEGRQSYVNPSFCKRTGHRD